MRRRRPRIAWGLGLAACSILAACACWAVARGWHRWQGQALAPARAAYAGRDWTSAASLARQRLKAEPGDVEALRLLARATARLGRDSSANSLFQRLGAEAFQAEDYYLLGLGLSHAGQAASAERMWERAVALDGEHSEALDALARAYAAGNRPDEAAHLAGRLALRPGWELTGELMWGALRFELEDPAGAAEVLNRALGRPEFDRLDSAARAEYRKMLARALLRTGRPDEARRWLTPMPGQASDPEISWLLSRAALEAGDIPAARTALQAAGNYRAEHRMEPEPGAYVGEKTCADCHQEIARRHQSDRHASTLVRGKELARLPYPDGPIPDPDAPSVVHRFRRKGDQIRFETEAAGAVRSAVVSYAFGSPDHYVSLVGPDDGGRDYILRLSHYATARDAGWVRTTGHTADVSGSRDYLGKPLEGSDGLYRCLFCHATNPRSVLEGQGPASHDRAIGCERCHGPGELHVKAAGARLSDLAIVNPAAGTSEDRMRLCGQCHSQHLTLPSPPPRTDPYWIRFQGTTLTWSRCYTDSGGALDCITCHDAHHDVKRSEAEHVARCLDCHAPAAAPAGAKDKASPSTTGPAAHGAACPVNPTSGCIGCHMPPYESPPLHAIFTDHYIRVHPGQGSGSGSAKPANAHQNPS